MLCFSLQQQCRLGKLQTVRGLLLQMRMLSLPCLPLVVLRQADLLSDSQLL